MILLDVGQHLPYLARKYEDVNCRTARILNEHNSRAPVNTLGNGNLLSNENRTITFNQTGP